MSQPQDNVAAVLDKEYRRPFTLIVGIVSAVVLLLFGVNSAEKFVDGRVELKLGDQRRQQEEQKRRLEQIEAQFANMRDTLSEIRADVRVLRARFDREAK